MGRRLIEERGFTLPELLITIAVMGILLAIAVPSWNSYTDSRRVVSAQNQLASDLRLAHGYAWNRLAPAYVRLSADGVSYEIQRFDVEEGEYETMSRRLPDGTKAEVVASTTPGVMNFWPEGYAGEEVPAPDAPEIVYEIQIVASDGGPAMIRVGGATSCVSALENGCSIS